MKLIYAAMFALFPLAAPAQTLDPSTLGAVCNDDHCDDSCSQVDALDSGGILSDRGYPGKIQCRPAARSGESRR